MLNSNLRDSQRLSRYKQYMAFYESDQWVGSARKNERRLTFNYVRTLIEKVTHKLLGGSVITVDPAGDIGQERALAVEETVRQLHEQNGLDSLDFENEIDTAVRGDGAYKVVWSEAQGRVLVTAPDPGTLFVETDPDDYRVPIKVTSSTVITRDVAALAYGVSVPRTTTKTTEIWTAATYCLKVDDKTIFDGANPYGEIPYVIFPNIRKSGYFWGISDVELLIDPQRELNRSFTQLSRIMEMSGNPVTVLENVDQSQDIAVGPGAIWDIPEKAKAYLLDLLSGGGVQLHIDYLNALYRVMHDIAETPLIAFGTASAGATAGVALEIELQPLIDKVTRKRLVRTAVYEARARMMLRRLAQFGDGDEFPATGKLRMIWAAVTPRDVTRQVDDERLRVAVGLSSRKSSMDRLGVEDPKGELDSWFVEQERLSNLATSAAPATSPPDIAGQTAQRRVGQ